jgi:Glutathione S-transferase, N-terminal domain
MAQLKLTYFDFHGGHGEPARLALSMGGIPFEDDRVLPSEWGSRKANTPFGALPVLEVDGEVVAQSNAINRYVGKLADLYPSDAWQAALCDEVMEAVEDIGTKIAATLFLPEEQKKTQRKELVEGPIPFYLTRLEQRLEAHGGQYSPPIVCQSLISRCLYGFGILSQVRSIMCRLTCLIESRQNWFSTMSVLRTIRASRTTIPNMAWLADKVNSVGELPLLPPAARDVCSWHLADMPARRLNVRF